MSTQAYVETEILSATPQKLRLLMLEGAIRLSRATIAHWDEENHEAGLDTLGRARAIVTELIASVTMDRAGLEHIVDHVPRTKALSPAERQQELARLEAVSQATAGVYVFIFRSLTQAQMQHDRQQLEAIVGILQEERETARLLCEQLPDAPQLNVPRASQQEVTADGGTDDDDDATYGHAAPPKSSGRNGVSFEA